MQWHTEGTEQVLKWEILMPALAASSVMMMLAGRNYFTGVGRIGRECFSAFGFNHRSTVCHHQGIYHKKLSERWDSDIYVVCSFVLPFWRTVSVVKLLVFSNKVLRTGQRGMGYVVRMRWSFYRLSAVPYNCWLPFLLLCSPDTHFSPDNNFWKWLPICHLCGFSLLYSLHMFFGWI